MKKFSTLLFLSLIVITKAYSQIPNPSYEAWTTYPSGEYPTFWNTTDSAYQAIGGGHSAIRETVDKCDGSNSVKLTSIAIFVTNLVPGVITNGKLISPTVITGGNPFTSRPAFFNGCYKYVPSGADTGRVTALLSKWNGTSRDTIAFAYGAPTSVPTLTNFQIPFVYHDLVNAPDTILIVIASGRGIQATNAGSYLIIDNVSTSGTVGISENTVARNIRIFPQPAQNELNISMDISQNTNMTYEVADITGRKILTGKMNSSSEKIDISSLTRGNYFIAFRNEAGAILNTSRFSVAK
jgi:hypothetical protein